MAVPKDHTSAAAMNRHGDDLLNDVRRQKSNAARLDPQADRSSEIAERVRRERWSSTTSDQRD